MDCVRTASGSDRINWSLCRRPGSRRYRSGFWHARHSQTISYL